MSARPILRKALIAGVVVASAGVAAPAGAAPAPAAPRYGCEWPRVCIYRTWEDKARGVPNASFRDAGYWQALGSVSSAEGVYNARRDDGALLEMRDGSTWCVGPGEYSYLWPEDAAGDAVRIMITDSPVCEPSD